MTAIYEPIVRDTVVSFETEPPDVDEMHARLRDVTRSFPWLVCESDGALTGYAYAAPYHPRAAYAWTCEVSVYVAERGRGRGVGALLLHELLEALRARGFVGVLARIALPNDASVRLFEKAGFRYVGVTEKIGYKLGRWVDVGEWQLQLVDPPSDPAPPVVHD